MKTKQKPKAVKGKVQNGEKRFPTHINFLKAFPHINEKKRTTLTEEWPKDTIVP